MLFCVRHHISDHWCLVEVISITEDVASTETLCISKYMIEEAYRLAY